jgi:hypothetical protein
MGYSHNSIIGGTFLYYKVTPGGYFEYIINGVNVYIKNIGFLWVLQSFNYVKKLESKRWHVDYDNLFEEFHQYSVNNNKHLLVDKIIDIMNTVQKEPNKSDKHLFEKLIADSKLFITKLPKDSIIVNKGNPYIIMINYVS